MPRRSRSAERVGERVHAQPLAVERDAHGVDAEARQPRQRAAVARLLDQHGVAAGREQRIDEVDGLQRARRDQDLLGVAGDAGVPLELARQELAAAAGSRVARSAARRWKAYAPRAGARHWWPRSGPPGADAPGRCVRRRSCAWETRSTSLPAAGAPAPAAAPSRRTRLPSVQFPELGIACAPKTARVPIRRQPDCTDSSSDPREIGAIRASALLHPAFTRRPSSGSPPAASPPAPPWRR